MFQRFERDDDNTGAEFYQAYHQWNAFQGWLTNHPAALENFNPFKVSVINYSRFKYLSFKLTHLFAGIKVAFRQLFLDGRAAGVFPMRNGCLWERVFAANGDRAVRPEAAVKPRVIAMAVGYDNENDVMAWENDGMAEDPPRRSMHHCRE